MKQPTVAEAWQDYVKTVMPKGVSKVQIQETRRAFYSGYWTLMCRIKEIGDDGTVTEEQGAKFLSVLDRELNEFYTALKEGRA